MKHNLSKYIPIFKKLIFIKFNVYYCSIVTTSNLFTADKDEYKFTLFHGWILNFNISLRRNKNEYQVQQHS